MRARRQDPHPPPSHTSSTPKPLSIHTKELPLCSGLRHDKVEFLMLAVKCLGLFSHWPSKRHLLWYRQTPNNKLNFSFPFCALKSSLKSAEETSLMFQAPILPDVLCILLRVASPVAQSLYCLLLSRGFYMQRLNIFGIKYMTPWLHTGSGRLREEWGHEDVTVQD